MLVSVVLGLIGSLLSWVPAATTLPTFLGINLDKTFQQGVSYFRDLAILFPPFNTIAICAGVYLSFRLILAIVKLFLGSRAPQVHR